MAVPVLGFVAMSVDFLSDQEAAAFGRYGGVPSGVELERFFFLDDEDRALVARHRGDHNRLGFGVQLTTVRYLGRFLADPLDGVPVEVVDYLAEQLEVADPSCLKRYAQRAETHREHVGEIRRALGLRDFAAVAGQLRGWVDKWAWVSGDGPKAIFAGAVSWLRERGVLLPGVSTLTLLVSEVRAEVTRRLWRTLYEALTHEQRAAMDALLEVAPGERVSQLQRWRTGSARCSGPEMVKALHRVAEILGSGLSRVQVDATVSPRRLRELASYGMGTDVTQLRRHRDPRRLATMVATVAHLEAAATDDALELLDLLMVTELIGKARRETDKRTLSRAPQLARASATLAVVAQILLEAQAWGSEDQIPVARVWEAIEARFPRAQVQADAATVAGQISPVQPADGQWRSELAGRRIATVSGFVKTLTATITFGATGEGAPVLAAMRDLGEQLASSAQWSVRNPRIHAQVVPGPWKHLVFGHPADPRGEIDKNAYTYCVLEAFHRYLRRREIYAPASTRWRDPRAHLLEGEQWEVVRDDVLTVLDLPADPDALLAQHVQTLEEAYIYVGGRLIANTDVQVDAAGKIHVSTDKAIEDPPSLIDLRKRVAAMLPRVDIGEAILEVMGWVPHFMDSLTALSRGQSRLADLDITVAACLTGQALNIGYGPIAAKGVPALERRRMGHITVTYLRAENYTAANPHLVARQAGIDFAQRLGGGLVAAIDGMRFVVPVPSLLARPNRKYFGPKRGMTFLNMIFRAKLQQIQHSA